MSLFPAYLDSTTKSSSTADVEVNEEQKVQSEWLKNSSFEPEASKLINDIIKEDKKQEHVINVKNSYKLYKKLHGKKKKKKDKKHVKKIKRPKLHVDQILKDCDFVTIDCKRELGNLKVEKLYRPAAPI